MLKKRQRILGNLPKTDGELQDFDGKKVYFTCLFKAPAISNMEI
jgi:hypothetical protein